MSDKHDTWRELADEAGNMYAQSSEPERETFRSWLKDLLRDEIVTVTFNKADGAERRMKCTLNEVHGAKYNPVNESQNRRTNPEVCVVWDLEQQNWRSFRWDRIKRIEFTLG